MSKHEPNKKLMKKNEKLLRPAKELGLNQKQFDDINRAFCLFDRDGNGKISRGELSDVIRMLGRSMSDQDIDAMMTNADTDKSGFIEFHEFLPLIAIEFTNKQHLDKEVKDTFRSFDINGDGVISAREFRLAVAKMGQNLSDAEVAEFMRSVDKDGDGVISFEEFAKYVISNI